MGYWNKLNDLKNNKKKSFAILIDPDKIDSNKLIPFIQLAKNALVDYIFIGGSLVTTNNLDEYIKIIKRDSNIPVILFPGSPAQVSKEADALLYLSLISGRNPELLIGQHVLHAPFTKQSGLEIIPTGYILIDGGAPTSVSYISNTNPIPADKNDIAICTAMAGEMLGLKTIFLDAGSGAINPVSIEMISSVASNIQIPLIVGGGINTCEKAKNAAMAGANIIVVGNVLEKNPNLMKEISDAIHS